MSEEKSQGRSIFIPDQEELQVEVTVKDKTFTVDVFDLDDMIGDAYDAQKESGRGWTEQLAETLTRKWETPISKGQAYLLQQATSKQIDDLKKKSQRK